MNGNRGNQLKASNGGLQIYCLPMILDSAVLLLDKPSVFFAIAVSPHTQMHGSTRCQVVGIHPTLADSLAAPQRLAKWHTQSAEEISYFLQRRKESGGELRTWRTLWLPPPPYRHHHTTGMCSVCLCVDSWCLCLHLKSQRGDSDGRSAELPPPILTFHLQTFSFLNIMSLSHTHTQLYVSLRRLLPLTNLIFNQL